MSSNTIQDFANCDFGHCPKDAYRRVMTVFLPISATLSAIIAVYLAGLPAQSRLGHRLLAVVFGLFAAQQILTSMAIGGTFPFLSWWRPVLAVCIPPLLYLHLRFLVQTDARLRIYDLAHLLAPIFLAGSRLVIGGGSYIDGVIMLSQLAYAGTILWHLSPEPIGLRRWKMALVLWLLAMALADFLIGIEVVGAADLADSRILFTSVNGMVGALAYILITSLHQSGPLVWMSARLNRSAPPPADVQDRLVAHMNSARPWLDPELTVGRLARQLGVPQRHVSNVVNGAFGMSVSRWVNTYRIVEAKRLIEENPDQPLIDLMLDCGFQTRSNFNKAFREIAGVPPGEWRTKHLATRKGA